MFERTRQRGNKNYESVSNQDQVIHTQTNKPFIPQQEIRYMDTMTSSSLSQKNPKNPKKPTIPFSSLHHFPQESSDFENKNMVLPHGRSLAKAIGEQVSPVCVMVLH
ncbi:hypothetical protein Droror1_Dr00002793 [Drosera rotundifolia]